jgi:hypothetical protein
VINKFVTQEEGKMSIKHKIITSGVFFISAFTSLATQAQSSISVMLTDIQYQLIDLDQNDAIEPSITFNTDKFYGAISVERQIGVGKDVSSGLAYPKRVSLYNQDNWPGSSLSPQQLVFEGNTASLSDQGLFANSTNPLGTFANVTVSRNYGFTLSPKTAITISAQSSFSGAGDVPAEAPYTPDIFGNNTGYLAPYISISATSRVMFTQNNSNAGIDLDQKHLNTNASGNFSNSKMLTSTFQNTGNTPIYISADIAAFLSTSTVVPIPEASSSQQLCFGLIGLGLFLRIKKSLLA